MSPKHIEGVLSIVMAQWMIKKHPELDIETTRLEEMSDGDTGIILTVGDEEFRITVEQMR